MGLCECDDNLSRFGFAEWQRYGCIETSEGFCFLPQHSRSKQLTLLLRRIYVTLSGWKIKQNLVTQDNIQPSEVSLYSNLWVLLWLLTSSLLVIMNVTQTFAHVVHVSHFKPVCSQPVSVLHECCLLWLQRMLS